LLSTKNLSAIKASIGNNRMAASEFGLLQPFNVNQDMPAKTVIALLRYNQAVEQANLKGELIKAGAISKATGQINPGYGFRQAQKQNELTPPKGLSQIQFIRWANNNSIFGKAATAAWQHYESLGWAK
jgi:hypothetical protein